jgi:hypothetical protein
MADKVRFFVSSVLDDASLRASSATTGLNASNVTHDLIRRVYRSQSNENEWIVFSCSQAVTMDGVFLGHHNLTKNATIYWQGNTSDAWTSPALSVALSSATDAQGNTINKSSYFWSSDQAYQYWRLYIEDSGNSTLNLEVGRVFAGKAVEPTRNIREGFTLRTMDPSRIQKTAGRQGYANLKDRYDELTYSQGRMDEAGMDEIYGIYNTVGQHSAFVVALDPETRPNHHTYYAQFDGSLNRTQKFGHSYDLDSITISEKN